MTALGDSCSNTSAMKELFHLDPSLIFLNHGSFGACPKEVFAVLQEWQRTMEKNPVEFLGRRSAELLRQSREVLARYVPTGVCVLVSTFVPQAGLLRKCRRPRP
jgi:isopenicillin-N epimerase